MSKRQKGQDGQSVPCDGADEGEEKTELKRKAAIAEKAALEPYLTGFRRLSESAALGVRVDTATQVAFATAFLRHHEAREFDDCFRVAKAYNRCREEAVAALQQELAPYVASKNEYERRCQFAGLRLVQSKLDRWSLFLSMIDGDIKRDTADKFTQLSLAYYTVMQRQVLDTQAAYYAILPTDKPLGYFPAYPDYSCAVDNRAEAMERTIDNARIIALAEKLIGRVRPVDIAAAEVDEIEQELIEDLPELVKSCRRDQQLADYYGLCGEWCPEDVLNSLIRVEASVIKRESYKPVALVIPVLDTEADHRGTCQICLGNVANIALGCGHTLCPTCCDTLPGNKCAVCSAPIASKLILYLV